MKPSKRIYPLVAFFLVAAAAPSLCFADEITSGKAVNFDMAANDKLPTTTDGWFGKSFTFNVTEPGPFAVTVRPRGTGRVVFVELLSPAKKSLGFIEGKELRIPELPAKGEYQLNISSRDVGDISFTATFEGRDVVYTPGSSGESDIAKQDALDMIDSLSEEIGQIEQRLVELRTKLEKLRRAVEALPQAAE